MSKLTHAQYFDPNTDLGRRRLASIPEKFERIRSKMWDADLQWLVEEHQRQEERLAQKQGLIPYPPAPEPLQFPSAQEPHEHE
jgi:hypothetical protein